MSIIMIIDYNKIEVAIFLCDKANKMLFFGDWRHSKMSFNARFRVSDKHDKHDKQAIQDVSVSYLEIFFFRFSDW